MSISTFPRTQGQTMVDHYRILEKICGGVSSIFPFAFPEIQTVFALHEQTLDSSLRSVQSNLAQAGTSTQGVVDVPAGNQVLVTRLIRATRL